MEKKLTQSKLSEKQSTSEGRKLEKGERFLPIGTVVMLKGGKKRVMITGFCVSRKENPSEIWDYSGCVYPEGIFSADSVLLFDHTQITEVFYIGLIDEEEKGFKERLKEELKKINKKTEK